MSKRPWMKFYVNEWAADTKGMTPAAKGIYLDLIIALWKSADGTIPLDVPTLRRWTGCDCNNWQRAAGPVLAKFKVTDEGLLFHERVMEERGKANLPLASVKCAPSVVRSERSAYTASKSLKSLNRASKTTPLRARAIRRQSTESKNSGNISAAPLSARDHVSAPGILQPPVSLPREIKQKKRPRKRALKNGASADARAIFDRTTEGSELNGIPDRLMTDFLKGH